MDEELRDIIKLTLDAMLRARLSQYKDVDDLIECEIKLQDYLDMEDRLYDGYSKINQIWGKSF